jgi:hypothetical protein
MRLSVKVILINLVTINFYESRNEKRISINEYYEFNLL